MKKEILSAAVFLILAGGLYGQSIAELSHLEKARRESLKGKQARIVTNADLAAVKKRPAILVAPAETAPEENATAPGGQPLQGAGDGSDDTVMVPTVIGNGPAIAGPAAAAAAPTSVKDLENRLKAAEDLVGLLTDKMNMLVTQTSNLNGLNPQEMVMQQIDETNKRLAEARDDVENLKARLGAARKNPPKNR
jgi:hypothetical protein